MKVLLSKNDQEYSLYCTRSQKYEVKKSLEPIKPFDVEIKDFSYCFVWINSEKYIEYEFRNNKDALDFLTNIEQGSGSKRDGKKNNANTS